MSSSEQHTPGQDRGSNAPPESVQRSPAPVFDESTRAYMESVSEQMMYARRPEQPARHPDPAVDPLPVYAPSSVPVYDDDAFRRNALLSLDLAEHLEREAAGRGSGVQPEFAHGYPSGRGGDPAPARPTVAERREVAELRVQQRRDAERPERRDRDDPSQGH
jgi:hypothetical protein